MNKDTEQGAHNRENPQQVAPPDEVVAQDVEAGRSRSRSVNQVPTLQMFYRPRPLHAVIRDERRQVAGGR